MRAKHSLHMPYHRLTRGQTRPGQSITTTLQPVFKMGHALALPTPIIIAINSPTPTDSPSPASSNQLWLSFQHDPLSFDQIQRYPFHALLAHNYSSSPSPRQQLATSLPTLAFHYPVIETTSDNLNYLDNHTVRKKHNTSQRHHVKDVFEVSETLAPADNRNYTYRGTTVSITCSGWDGDNEREYDGDLIAYCSSMEVPLENHCYAVKAKMIPGTETADYKLYYEADHKILVGNSDTFAGELHNNTSASGFGTVSSRRELPEADSDDVTLAFTMSHVDYNPQLRENIEFEVEYRIRPTVKMKASQVLIQDGKETLVHGFIVDWDNEVNRWIVEVTSLNVASGHAPTTKKRINSGTKVTPTGRVRPANLQTRSDF
ncbi:uncharacterized protein MELLADRAFT_85520 [Melampsora larici-populina 98AG31]|uniref:Uncharacterized protein n=1 Tax=Melampsora larici-populina (strain 98AG31 / pathotype 3-4-7) TaxID=747676 RepID=F4RJ04_MELLP|nr:uncharacterized protein MELLADRAFT_85520 [Melampsora larici-populina 98AG31]EGG07739.1 hypothetical protein MELLADRAFT_85520 [Melampsora larici-populina 98AG31]